MEVRRRSLWEEAMLLDRETFVLGRPFGIHQLGPYNNLLSFFEIPKGVSKILDFYISRFFGKANNLKTNIDLQNGTLFVDRKIKGDWSCLLSKWLFNFLSEEGMWQELLHNKYSQSYFIPSPS
jgi:hypothetical protein